MITKVKKRTVVTIILVALFATGIFLSKSTTAYGVETLHEGRQMGNTQIHNDPQISKTLEILQDNDIASIENLVKDGFRMVGFYIVTLLADLIDGLFSTLKTIIDFLSFSYSDNITSLLNKYRVLYRIFFIVTLTGFGLYLIMGKSNFQELNTVNCLILIAIIVTSMPLITEKFSNLTIASSKYVIDAWQEDSNKQFSSIAQTVINSQVYDLCIVDKKIGNDGNVKIGKNGMNNLGTGAKAYKAIDINKALDDDVYDLEHPEVFKYEREQGSDGNYMLTTLHNVILPDTFYYRYQVKSWMYLFIVLLSAAACLGLMLLRISRLIFEIAFSNIYMPFVAVTDIASGTRIKEGLKGFITLFAAIFLAIAMFGVFVTGFAYINVKFDNEYLKYILIIALAWAVIDGSSQLERIIGVDIGLKSGWQMIMGAASSASLVKNTTKAGSKVAKIPFKSANSLKRAGKSALAAKNRLQNRLSNSASELSKTDSKSNSDNKQRSQSKTDRNQKKTLSSNLSKKITGNGIGKGQGGKGKSALSANRLKTRNNNLRPTNKGKSLSPGQKMSLKQSPKSLNGLTANERKINSLKQQKAQVIREKFRAFGHGDLSEYNNRLKNIDGQIAKLEKLERIKTNE